MGRRGGQERKPEVIESVAFLQGELERLEEEGRRAMAELKAMLSDCLNRPEDAEDYRRGRAGLPSLRAEREGSAPAVETPTPEPEEKVELAYGRESGGKRRIPEAVLAELSAMRFEGANAYLAERQLERPLYEAVNFALAELGGKWTKRARAHVFPGDARARVEGAILTGDVSVAADLGFFVTPPAVVQRVMELAEVRRGMRVLEPSAGTGAFAEEIRKAGAILLCVEVDPTRGCQLRDRGFIVDVSDFVLDVRPEVTDLFDRVVMNPPFAKGQDVDHVMHATRFLKPGGRLVAVVSAGVTFREDARYVAFRSTVAAVGGRIEKLPEGAFRESGTGVSTALVVMDMPANHHTATPPRDPGTLAGPRYVARRTWRYAARRAG